MNENGARLLMLTVLGSLLLGVGVLAFDDNYTVEQNVASNKKYCPTINAFWDESQRPAAAARPSVPNQNDRPADRGSGADAE